MEIVNIDLEQESHCEALLSLMNDYMSDPMGGGKPIEESHKPKLISALRKQNNYVGFLLTKNGENAALANCFVNFSTFQAKQLINIHDFVVNPDFRRQGLGEALLTEIAQYAKNKDMCRVTLEVRDDNPHAMNLYKKMGFDSCSPNYYFWEKPL